MAKKPTMKFSECMKEVSRRTGFPYDTVHIIMKTYSEIVKECLFAQVCCVFDDICVFGLKKNARRMTRMFTSKVEGGSDKPEDYVVPSYYRPSVRWKDVFRRKLKELTIPLFPENFEDDEEELYRIMEQRLKMSQDKRDLEAAYQAKVEEIKAEKKDEKNA